MFDHCLYFNLSTLSRKINRRWQLEFDKLGLSPSHGYLLFAICESPQLRQKDLGTLLELDASTITRFIDTLAHKGLIEKKSRGKGADFGPTPEGKALYKRIQSTMETLFLTMQKRLGKPRFKSFVADLQHIREIFKED